MTDRNQVKNMIPEIKYTGNDIDNLKDLCSKLDAFDKHLCLNIPMYGLWEHCRKGLTKMKTISDDKKIDDWQATIKLKKEVEELSNFIHDFLDSKN